MNDVAFFYQNREVCLGPCEWCDVFEPKIVKIVFEQKYPYIQSKQTVVDAKQDVEKPQNVPAQTVLRPNYPIGPIPISLFVFELEAED